MVTKELRMAATEINQILRYTEEKDVNKIPLGLRLFFKEIADEGYIPNINPEISLYSQKLMDETEQILGMLYCYYWSTEDELQSVPDKVKEKAIKVENEISQNYSPDELFEGSRERRKNSIEGKALINTKDEAWYNRFWSWIKNLFK